MAANPKAYMIGHALGWVLARIVDLMYQNNTAGHFLRGLVCRLEKEMEERKVSISDKRYSHADLTLFWLSSPRENAMSQWGPIFYEGGLRVASLIGTEAFREIADTDLVEALVVLDGEGDLDSLRNKYVGITLAELRCEADING